MLQLLRLLVYDEWQLLLQHYLHNDDDELDDFDVDVDDDENEYVLLPMYDDFVGAVVKVGQQNVDNVFVVVVAVVGVYVAAADYVAYVVVGDYLLLPLLL